MRILSRRPVRVALAVIGCLMLLDVAHAQAQNPGQDVPWVEPLQAIGTALTGGVARAIGLLALAASGGMLAFGGELGEFTKRLLMVVLAISVMIMASQFMELFFPE